MAIQITIRDVPEKVRDELAGRAALQGKSLQEYLRAELERMAAHPSADVWLEQARKRRRISQTRLSSRQILESRDADRRELDAPSPEHATPRTRTLALDIEKYKSYLQDMDISEAQKAEVLQTLWSIMSAFVDLGFGTDSVQRSLAENDRDAN